MEIRSWWISTYSVFTFRPLLYFMARVISPERSKKSVKVVW